MQNPLSSLRSKNDRAIVAYLISVGCGTEDDVFPSKSTKSKKFPNTVVHSKLSKPEENYTGNRRVRTVINIFGSATVEEGEDKSDPLTEFNSRVGNTMNAMMQTDDNQTLRWTARAITAAGRALAVPVDGSDEAIAFAQANADMADYTCLDLYEAGEGDGGGDDVDSEATAWHEFLIFDVICCPSAVN